MDTLLQIGLSNAVVAVLLAVPAALASKLLRKPALAHGLWLLVFIKLVTPPLVNLPLHWPGLSRPAFLSWSHNGASAENEGLTAGEESISSETVADVVTGIAGHGDETSLDDSLPASASQAPTPVWSFTDLAPWIALFWVGGSIGWLATAGCRIVRFHRLLRFGKLAPQRWQARAAALADRLGLARCPELWLVPGHISPLVWALGWRVRLVLPEELLKALTPEQQDALLAHELAHAQRRDHWVRWLELVATGIYWWHPVVWWARHELHIAEEQCCDAWVVWTLPGAARTYARALLQTVEFLDAQPALPPVASGIGHVQSLKRRLRMIVQQPPCPQLSRLFHLGIAALGLLVLPVGLQHLQANNVVPDAPVVGTADDDDADAPRDQDRQMRDLDRRLRALETRLDRVLRSLESRAPADRSAERSSEDRAKQAEQKTRDKDREMKQKLELRFRDAEKKLAEQQKRLEKQAQDLKRRFDADTRDGGRRGANEFEWRFEGDGKFDPERLKALQQQIESAVKEAVNPERMKKMEKDIQDSLDKAINPERMKQLQAQIEQSVKRSINPERIEALAKQIEATVQKSLAAEERERTRQAERARASAAAKARPRTEPPGTPETSRRDLERRMDQLEERMNRLLEALEKDKSGQRRQ
jgi:bla regulator protein blaR1